MESDSDIRQISKAMQEATATIWGSVKDVLKANPKAYVAASIGNSILQSLSVAFSQNGDDTLFRASGTFFREPASGDKEAFEDGTVYTHGNEWISCEVTPRVIKQNDQSFKLVKSLSGKAPEEAKGQKGLDLSEQQLAARLSIRV